MNNGFLVLRCLIGEVLRFIEGRDNARLNATLVAIVGRMLTWRLDVAGIQQPIELGLEPSGHNRMKFIISADRTVTVVRRELLDGASEGQYKTQTGRLVLSRRPGEELVFLSGEACVVLCFLEVASDGTIFLRFDLPGMQHPIILGFKRSGKRVTLLVKMDRSIKIRRFKYDVRELHHS